MNNIDISKGYLNSSCLRVFENLVQSYKTALNSLHLPKWTITYWSGGGQQVQ